MTDILNAPLDQVRQQIVAAGAIEPQDVKQLRKRILSDREVTRHEAELILQLNNQVPDSAKDSHFRQLYVDVMLAHLLRDDQSRGEVDEVETEWLLNWMNRDERINEIERELIHMLMKKTNGNLPLPLKQLVEA